MITRGLSSLDVPALVNLEYLGFKCSEITLLNMLVVSGKVYNKSFTSYSFIFHLQPFQILSKIFYMIINTCVKYYTNAELYKIDRKVSKL